MYKKLNEIIADDELNNLAKECAKKMLEGWSFNSQEETNVKTALIKQSFLRSLDYYFENEFCKVSEELLLDGAEQS